jgi:hypothetical protein
MKRHVKKILDNLYGPTGSVILHILVVVALLKFIQYSAREQEPEIEVVIMEPTAVEVEEEPPELEPPEELPEIEDAVTPPDVPMDLDQPPAVDSPAPPSDEPPLETAALDVVADVASPLVMKGLFAGRSAAGRAAALGAYAGRWGQYTEAAVLKALEWLKRNQAADGSWGPSNKEAMTGLGLLTFLAHGETPGSEKYGQTVEKAIRYLVQKQDETGRFCSTDNQPGPYAQSIATYAVSEAYGVTRIPALKSVMEKAIQVLIDGQQPGGGWDYKYARAGRRDTSLGGWHVQALKAAFVAGASNPGLKNAIEKAVQDLKSVHIPETGEFYYSGQNSHRSHSITAVAVLCLQLTGNANSKEARAGLQALRDADCDWQKPPSWALYSWYYTTQAKFHFGGGGWDSWNEKFARALVRSQNEDGSWTAPGEAAGVAEGKETNNGPVYATTLCALTLQVYYRLLPTYKASAVETHEEKPKEDTVIEII